MTHGLFDSDVPGRTDRLPVTVGEGAYIIPADIVSGIGQGNTKAGATLLGQIMDAFNVPAQRKAGGATEAPSKGVPIIVAGGEYMVPPQIVKAIGGGDLAKGHKHLDKLVSQVRRTTAERLRTLPKPKK